MRVDARFEKRGNCVIEITVPKKDIASDFKQSKFFLDWTCSWVTGAIRGAILNELVKILDDPVWLHEREFRNQMNEICLEDAAKTTMVAKVFGQGILNENAALKGMIMGTNVKEEKRDTSYIG
jgi:hypothetical protein